MPVATDIHPALLVRIVLPVSIVRQVAVVVYASSRAMSKPSLNLNPSSQQAPDNVKPEPKKEHVAPATPVRAAIAGSMAGEVRSMRKTKMCAALRWYD